MCVYGKGVFESGWICKPFLGRFCFLLYKSITDCRRFLVSASVQVNLMSIEGAISSWCILKAGNPIMHIVSIISFKHFGSRSKLYMKVVVVLLFAAVLSWMHISIMYRQSILLNNFSCIRCLTLASLAVWFIDWLFIFCCSDPWANVQHHICSLSNLLLLTMTFELKSSVYLFLMKHFIIRRMFDLFFSPVG